VSAFCALQPELDERLSAGDNLGSTLEFNLIKSISKLSKIAKTICFSIWSTKCVSTPFALLAEWDERLSVGENLTLEFHLLKTISKLSKIAQTGIRKVSKLDFFFPS
jgi:hypothetical protein